VARFIAKGKYEHLNRVAVAILYYYLALEAIAKSFYSPRRSRRFGYRHNTTQSIVKQARSALNRRDYRVRRGE